MAEKRNINMTIIDGDAFFSHETSVNFSPMQFILDFRSITPRIDARSPHATVALRHNVVIMDPYHAKQVSGLLAKVIKKYEAEFGKIEKPEALKKFESKQERLKAEAPSAEETTHKSRSYFG